MEDILFTLGGIGLAVLISAAIILFQRRKRAQSWEGVVTDIRHTHVQKHEDDPVTEPQIQVIYRKIGAGTGKLTFDERGFRQVFPDLEVGDRLIKEAGACYPHVAANRNS